MIHASVISHVLCLTVLVGLELLSSGCTNPPSHLVNDISAEEERVIGGSRPARLRLPASYDPSKAYPLVVMLHALANTQRVEFAKAFVGLREVVDTKKFVLLEPDGTRNIDNRFWNATPACCGTHDSHGNEVDDVAYLTRLITEAKGSASIDPRQIYVLGHSNGGFMAYRLACDRAWLVSAIVSLAGAATVEPTRCSPSQPVSVLHIHGNADETIFYSGGKTDPNDLRTAYPGARESVDQWAAHAGCLGKRVPQPDRLDLDKKVPGEETTVEIVDGCPKRIGIELWTMKRNGHVPDLSSGNFANETVQWLLNHGR